MRTVFCHVPIGGLDLSMVEPVGFLFGKPTAYKRILRKITLAFHAPYIGFDTTVAHVDHTSVLEGLVHTGCLTGDGCLLFPQTPQSCPHGHARCQWSSVGLPRSTNSSCASTQSREKVVWHARQERSRYGRPLVASYKPTRNPVNYPLKCSETLPLCSHCTRFNLERIYPQTLTVLPTPPSDSLDPDSPVSLYNSLSILDRTSPPVKSLTDCIVPPTAEIYEQMSILESLHSFNARLLPEVAPAHAPF